MLKLAILLSAYLVSSKSDGISSIEHLNTTWILKHEYQLDLQQFTTSSWTMMTQILITTYLSLSPMSLSRHPLVNQAMDLFHELNKRGQRFCVTR
ncbi:hypothetical protein B0H34DRAFT_701810 [Crassisporium funariophilum]|nr:hypothetical protein B0H34DRAFT_701810 [Crassisporium funariophilum]